MTDRTVTIPLVRRPPSGQHPAVREMRAKLESMQDHQLADLVDAREHVRQKLADARSDQPDPRRETNSGSPDSMPADIPADVVVLPPNRPAPLEPPRPSPRGKRR